MLMSLLMVLYATSCNDKSSDTEEDSGVMVEMDSIYHAMNPMDLDFDSLELVMIDSGMAELMGAYRAIRAYGLPNSTPPAIQFNPLPYGFQLPEPTAKIQWEIPESPGQAGRPTWPLCPSQNLPR